MYSVSSTLVNKSLNYKFATTDIHILTNTLQPQDNITFCFYLKITQFKSNVFPLDFLCRVFCQCIIIATDRGLHPKTTVTYKKNKNKKYHVFHVPFLV